MTAAPVNPKPPLRGMLRPAASFVGLLACAFSLAAASSGSQAQEDYQRGFREGYDQGYRQGYERARNEAQSNAPPPGAYVAPPPTYVVPAVPKRGIIVTRAWYGDGERRACNLTGWAARLFNNRTSQSVNVTNEICGDPAPGQRKELVVEYMCGAETKRASAYEHRSLSISCY
jgi:hypothetical protein